MYAVQFFEYILLVLGKAYFKTQRLFNYYVYKNNIICLAMGLRVYSANSIFF